MWFCIDRHPHMSRRSMRECGFAADSKNNMAT
jgi:hypothetical protein